MIDNYYNIAIFIMDDLMRSFTLSIQSFLGIDTEEDIGLRALGRTREEIQYHHILQQFKVEFEKRWEKSDVEIANLNNFVRLRALGHGTYGTVVLMKHKESEAYFAAKIMRKVRLVKTKQVNHALLEKQVLQSIRYPFVVHMEYFVMDKISIYFIMPYVSGGELYAHMKRVAKFDERLAKFYAAQVCLAIEYLHAMDLLYRDLKPENIMLSTNGYLKLTDFGFAKICKGRTYTLCGTPDYMAPEIVLSKGHSKPADWWSYGVLLFEMCSGKPPFHADVLMDVYHRIVKAKYKFPHHFSRDMKDLIHNLLKTDPTRRFGNLRNGVYDIKKHAWFKNIDFRSLFEQKVNPPFVPMCKSVADANNFIAYTDEVGQRSDSLEDDEIEDIIFKEFLQ